MKKLTIFLSLIMVFSFANAQDNYENDEIQSIFSRKKSNGGYGQNDESQQTCFFYHQ